MSSRKRKRDHVPLEHEIFTQWAIDRGVEIHKVRPADLPQRGIGLVTTGEIKKDDRIMFVPEKAMFKPLQSVVDPSRSQTWMHKASSQLQLAMSIMLESLKSDSPYHKWQATWPTAEDLLPTLPLFWPEKFQNLSPPSLMQPLERQKSDYQKDFETAKAYVKQGSPVWSEEDFKYYWSIVNSRSFHFKPAGNRSGYMVLCPFIDYMNHGPTGTGVNVTQSARGYEVTANRDYAPGEEILATYGSHPNEKLLVHYGFVLGPDRRYMHAPDDDIRLDSVIIPALPAATRSALQDVGFLGGYALLPEKMELCFKTQVAVRACILTANEWEYFIANGEDLSGDQSAKVREWLLPKMKALDDLARERMSKLYAMKGPAARLLKDRWEQIGRATHSYVLG